MYINQPPHVMVSVPDLGVISFFFFFWSMGNLNHVTTLVHAKNIHDGAAKPQSFSHLGRKSTFLITEYKLFELRFFLCFRSGWTLLI